jgi:hypothetical protein
MSRDHRYAVPQCMECLLFRQGPRKVDISVASSFFHVSDVGNVMHERAGRAHGGRGGLLNGEGAWKVLCPCDRIIVH